MSFFGDPTGFSNFFTMGRVVGMVNGRIAVEDLNTGLIVHLPSPLFDEDEDSSDEEEILLNCRPQRFKWETHKEDLGLNNRLSTNALQSKPNNSVKLSGNMESYTDNEDSETERREKIEEKNKIKAKEKAEKKRLKKQRQKERKRLQKELEGPSAQEQEAKDTDIDKSTLDKAGDEPGNDKTKDCLDLKDMAAAVESDCSNDSPDQSTDEENEGLDMASSFVTKLLAAEIVKRQSVQKQENKERKKSPVKEEEKVPEKSVCEENCVEKKDTSKPAPTMNDYIKMSTELAMIGNKQATAGNFKLAVRYFTDAIKFNPTEFRLFGNRAFCFEKMQEFDKALNDAELCLSMSPGWVKGLFRKGRALAGLKRYEEAANAFKEVIKLDGTCTEANQELVRMQIFQLMGYGFNQDQCSKALIIHGSVEKAREFLLKLKHQPVFPVAPQQVVNVTGLSPILSAKLSSAAAVVPPPLASKSPPEPPAPVQSHTPTKPLDSVPLKPNTITQSPELFPIWVGNVSFSATETLISNLFNKVGKVFSVKLLPSKRCAFVNFTNQLDCEDAIRTYHGYDLLGLKLAVRYPDRIPHFMNISKSAQKATDLSEENYKSYPFPSGRNGYDKPVNAYSRGPYKY